MRKNENLNQNAIALAKVSNMDQAEVAVSSLNSVLRNSAITAEERLAAMKELDSYIRNRVLVAADNENSQDDSFFYEHPKAWINVYHMVKAVCPSSAIQKGDNANAAAMKEELDKYEVCITAEDVYSYVSNISNLLSTPEFSECRDSAYRLLLRIIEDQIISAYFNATAKRNNLLGIYDTRFLLDALETAPYGEYTLDLLIVTDNCIKELQAVDFVSTNYDREIAGYITKYVEALGRMPLSTACAHLDSLRNVLPGYIAYQIPYDLAREELALAVKLTDLNRGLLDVADYSDADDSLGHVLDTLISANSLNPSVFNEQFDENWKTFKSGYKYCFECADMIADYGKNILIVELFTSLLKNYELPSNVHMLMRFTLALLICPLRLMSDTFVFNWVIGETEDE